VIPKFVLRAAGTGFSSPSRVDRPLTENRCEGLRRARKCLRASGVLILALCPSPTIAPGPIAPEDIHWLTRAMETSRILAKSVFRTRSASLKKAPSEFKAFEFKGAA
jgi:hypothetical protein